MSKRILAVLAACALMISALVAPVASDAKKSSRSAKAKSACIFQPLDDVLKQVNILVAPIVSVKLRLCGPITR